YRDVRAVGESDEYDIFQFEIILPRFPGDELIKFVSAEIQVLPVILPFAMAFEVAVHTVFLHVPPDTQDVVPGIQQLRERDESLLRASSAMQHYEYRCTFSLFFINMFH